MNIVRGPLHVVVEFHINAVVVAILVHFDETNLSVFEVVLVLIEDRTHLHIVSSTWILAEDLPLLEEVIWV